MADLTRPVSAGDCGYVIDNVREADRIEAEALGLSVYDGVHLSVRHATTCLTLVCPQTGLPGAILGTQRITDEYGLIWLVGTPLIERNSRCFLRQSKLTLPYLYERTGVASLGNYVHTSNQLHVKWLRWLGFKFFNKVQLGPMNEEFYGFVSLKG